MYYGSETADRIASGQPVDAAVQQWADIEGAGRTLHVQSPYGSNFSYFLNSVSSLSLLIQFFICVPLSTNFQF